MIKRLTYTLLLSLLLCSCHTSRKATVIKSGKDAIVMSKSNPLETPYIKNSDLNEITLTLLNEAFSWLGTPYKYGGADKNGADCSGLVMMVYLNALDIKLPRVSREQDDFCEKIKKEDLFPGDLVFFSSGKKSTINHVGIYIGDGKMIHASSSKGVMVSDLTQKYYIDHYRNSGRISSYHKLIKKNKK